MAQAPPDTEVFDVADVSVSPLPIDPCTWELVNDVLPAALADPCHRVSSA